MELKIKMKNDGSHYHYYIEFEREFFTEYKTQAQILNMESDEYREKLVNEFNGNGSFSIIYFQNENDVKAAIKWIESIIIMETLMGQDPQIKFNYLVEPYLIMEKLCN